MEKFLHDSDFVFIKGKMFYQIYKDRYNLLARFEALDKPSFETIFSNKEYKVSLIDNNGDLVRKNYGTTTKSAMDLVKSVIEEVTNSYQEKMRLIDTALAKGDKDTFTRLTSELYGGIGNGV